MPFGSRRRLNRPRRAVAGRRPRRRTKPSLPGRDRGCCRPLSGWRRHQENQCRRRKPDLVSQRRPAGDPRRSGDPTSLSGLARGWRFPGNRRCTVHRLGKQRGDHLIPLRRPTSPAPQAALAAPPVAETTPRSHCSTKARPVRLDEPHDGLTGEAPAGDLAGPGDGTDGSGCSACHRGTRGPVEPDRLATVVRPGRDRDSGAAAGPGRVGVPADTLAGARLVGPGRANGAHGPAAGTVSTSAKAAASSSEQRRSHLANGLAPHHGDPPRLGSFPRQRVIR